MGRNGGILKDLLSIELPDSLSIQTAAREIPGMNVLDELYLTFFRAQTVESFEDRARQLAKAIRMDFRSDVLYFRPDGTRYATFENKQMQIRIGCLPKGEHQAAPSLFISIELQDDYPDPLALFGMILANVVFMGKLPEARTTIRDREDLTATAALVSCLLPPATWKESRRQQASNPTPPPDQPL